MTQDWSIRSSFSAVANSLSQATKSSKQRILKLRRSICLKAKIVISRLNFDVKCKSSTMNVKSRKATLPCLRRSKL